MTPLVSPFDNYMYVCEEIQFECNRVTSRANVQQIQAASYRYNDIEGTYLAMVQCSAYSQLNGLILISNIST